MKSEENDFFHFDFQFRSYFSLWLPLAEYSNYSSWSRFLKGREDDNIETIGKQFKAFMESSLPVIEYYNSMGKIDAAKPVDAIFEDVKVVFASLNEKVRHD
ncbi:UMP-CMP kinase 3 [Ancistrocladus abbreviatus]